MEVLGMTDYLSNYIIRPSRSLYDIADLGKFFITKVKPALNLKILGTNELISLCLHHKITSIFNVHSTQKNLTKAI